MPKSEKRLAGASAADAVGARPRIALYSHDTMGIGHVRRNLLIAQALAAPPLAATVLLVAGVKEANEFALPPNTDCLTLPALHKAADGRYQSRALGLSLSELIHLRARALTSALESFRPDVLVVDKEPRGAVGELESALRALRARGRTRCVLGLRDVIDDPTTVRREWDAAGNEAAVREFYHAVWVYGDPGVYDLAREYRFGSDVRDKTTFVGYLDPRDRLRGQSSESRLAEPDLPREPFVLCAVGGGQDGARVAEAFVAAELPAGLAGVVITGPFMPPDARRRIHQRAGVDPRFRVLEFVAEPCRLLACAERVIAMGGYNTVCEVLAFDKPALIVPRVNPRREQLIRAERLRDLGLLDVLHPDAVCPEAMTCWLHTRPAAAQTRAQIDLGGADRLPALVCGLLSAAPARLPIPPRQLEVQHVAH